MQCECSLSSTFSYGLLLVGPPEHAMWALGDKIASSIVAQTAAVPTLPWSGSGSYYCSVFTLFMLVFT